MNIHDNNPQENVRKTVTTPHAQKQSSKQSTKQINDNRSTTVAQRKLQAAADNYAQMNKTAQLQTIADSQRTTILQKQGGLEEEELLQGKLKTLQRVEEEELLQGEFKTLQRVEEEELLQGKFETTQRIEEEEELLQGKFTTTQCMEEEEMLQGKFDTLQKQDNNTGLPDNLKSGMEQLSGQSLDHVKVHYNSSKPAAVQAHAYAQGSDIHLASGQEKHLPHELGHVVQQAQGRVKPTTSVGGMSVNDNPALENEATVMGERALQRAVKGSDPLNCARVSDVSATVQRQVGTGLNEGDKVYDAEGNYGVIIRFIFDPRDPRYLVDFIDLARVERSCRELFLTPPPSETSSYFDHDYSDEDDDTDEEAPMLARQHARRRGIFKHFQKLKKGRYGKSPTEGHSGKRGRAKRFLSRTKESLLPDPGAAMESKKTYSDKGAAMAVHGRVTKGLDATIGSSLATPIESMVTAPVDAAMGTNRRAGRTPGTHAIIEEKVGHVFSALGSLIQTIPVAGAAGGPVSGIGTYLQEHAQGASKEQAMVKALAATGAGTLAGLIPGYGTYSGTVGLIDDCRKLASNAELHGDPAYAAALLDRINEYESLIEQMKEEGMTGWDQLVEKELEKTYRRLAKEMRRREKQDRGQFGSKTGLLEEDNLLGNRSEEEDNNDF
jgi:hypothetical protein